jgi:dephospho-CoA kinase
MIIGVTGTNGAGKGTVVDYLVEHKGFTHFSVRDLIVEEVVRRGLELNRTNIGATGTALRRENEPHYFVKTFLARAKEQGLENVVIESIRAVAEEKYLKEHGGFVVAVDAPRELRYERIVGRASVTDKVTFEEFCAQENKEYIAEDSNDPTQMNFKAVMEGADYTIINDGSHMEFRERMEEMLAKLTV